MLRKILDLLNNKGIVSLKELSDEVGQSEEFVKMVLEELEKRGIIKGCTLSPSNCNGCPIKEKCKSDKKEMVYFLTNSRK